MTKKLTTFAFYIDDYLGSLITDEATFNSLLNKVSIYLGNVTLNKIFNEETSKLDVVQFCACELIDLEYQQLLINKNVVDNEGKEISSEKVGDYSVSYATGSNGVESLNTFNAKKRDIINRYLMNTGLLYRGAYVL